VSNIIDMEKILPGMLETERLYKSEDLSVNKKDLITIEIIRSIIPKKKAVLERIPLVFFY